MNGPRPDVVPVLAAGPGGRMPGLRDLAGRMGWRSLLDGAVPLAVFYPLDDLFGLRPAVIVATAVSLFLALLRRRLGGQASPFMWVTLAFLVVRGVVAAVTSSEVAYFGPNIAGSFLAAAIFLGSVIIGRPATATCARLVFGADSADWAEARTKRVFRRLSIGWGLYEAVAAVAQVWLLGAVSAGTFMAVRQGINTGGTIPMVVWSLVRLRPVITLRPAVPIVVVGGVEVGGTLSAPEVAS